VGGPADLQGGTIFFIWCPLYKVKKQGAALKQRGPGPRGPPDSMGLIIGTHLTNPKSRQVHGVNRYI